MNAAMVALTAVLAVATVALAWTTVQYVRAMHTPVVSAYFETDRTWVYLVIQNTGTETARNTQFQVDLTQAELEEIFGPNLHGKRYIVFEDLAFLDSVRHLAPQQRIRHQWLFLNFALRDSKPRPFTFTIRYLTPWNSTRVVSVVFDLRQFGTYDMGHLPDKTPLESMAESLEALKRAAEGLARERGRESA